MARDDHDAAVEYPTVGTVIAIHDDVVGEYPETPPGIRDRSGVEFAVASARGEVGPAPRSVHDRAGRLLRTLVVDHPFVDANKRTALCATATLYRLSGRTFEYDHGIRELLGGLATDEASVPGETLRGSLGDRAGPPGSAPEGGVAPPGIGDDGPAKTGGDGTAEAGGDGTTRVGGEGAGGRATVRRIARADREHHRAVYDALADE